jgi:hypothetical protein
VHYRAAPGKTPAQLCLRLVLHLVCLALVTGCAFKRYQPVDIDGAGFLQRAQTQESNGIRVTAAVPDAAETEALTGIALYEQGVQPVWLEVENQTGRPLRAALWSVDRDYFSPIEVAYMNRKKFSGGSYGELERWFHDNAMVRQVPPGETRSGFVFTHYKPGTKGFNLDLFSSTQPTTFTFFIPMPGFTADYTEVDFGALYTNDEFRTLDREELREALETELPCCVTDESGTAKGGPLNVVLVGSALAVRRSLLRGDWVETQREEMDRRGLQLQRYRGRRADATVKLGRKDGNEQIILHLWVTPWRTEGAPVWVGQVYYTTLDQQWIGALSRDSVIDTSSFLAQFASESVSADVDSALSFLVQNFWYNQSLTAYGLVDGIGAATIEEPHATFRGDAFFTKGQRAVMFLSETPVAIDEGKIIYNNPLGARRAVAP